MEPQTELKVIKFVEKYAHDFARLNYEWIEEYFTVEAHDREMLDNPVEYIINNGGQILFALVDGKAVGTVALIRNDEESFELAKMAVTAGFRGLKIGDKLMSACLDHAKKAGIKKVFLLSNTKLVPALTLYRKFGFMEVPIDPNVEYQRTDIQMELIIDK